MNKSVDSLQSNQTSIYFALNHTILYMSSQFDQVSTSDISLKIISHLKTYNIFVFYENSHFPQKALTVNLEKMSFRLRDQKAQHSDKFGENSKSVSLHFCDLSNEREVLNMLQQLKVAYHQFKTRIVCYSTETSLAQLYSNAKKLAIPIQSIPLCLYTSSIHSDLASFLGWGQPNISGISGVSMIKLEKDAKKWIESPTQKIDIWQVQISVAKQGGTIENLNAEQKNTEYSSMHKELLFSNLSIGYHPQLLMNYEEKRSSRQSSLYNKLIFSLQGIKKFCCVGNTDLKRSTGIVKIDFQDQKGSKQILKQLTDQSEFEEMQSTKFIHAKYRRKILSLVASNINRFMGEKIEENGNSRMNDKKLELLAFKSISDATQISSVSGQIRIEFSPEVPVDLQINDSCFRLERPQFLKITHYGKAKVLINKQMLSC